MPKVERGIADILRLQVQAYVKRPRRATKFLCDYVCFTLQDPSIVLNLINLLAAVTMKDSVLCCQILLLPA